MYTAPAALAQSRDFSQPIRARLVCVFTPINTIIIIRVCISFFLRSFAVATRSGYKIFSLHNCDSLVQIYESGKFPFFHVFIAKVLMKYRRFLACVLANRRRCHDYRKTVQQQPHRDRWEAFAPQAQGLSL